MSLLQHPIRPHKSRLAKNNSKSRITTWAIRDYYFCLLSVFQTYFTSSKSAS